MASMTAGERKSLEKLIDGDFAAVTDEVRSMGYKAQAQAAQAVRDEFAQLQTLVDEAEAELRQLEQAAADETTAVTQAAAASKTAIERQLVEERTALIAKYRDAGLVSSTNGRGTYSFTPDGLEDAVREAQQQVNVKLQDAVRNIERQRIEAQRRVLLGGLESNQALALVEGIPKADDVFAGLGLNRLPELTTGE